MQNLKNNKSAGPDGIGLELIKYREIRLLKRMCELLSKFGRQKEYLRNGKKQYYFLYRKKNR